MVLGSTEEITLMLDDNAMNLQSMTASRFVGPFVDEVQQWEKTLSHVGEVIEVWVVVQRKWQYLEGIFMAGDIRQQLPNEAKKVAERKQQQQQQQKKGKKTTPKKKGIQRGLGEAGKEGEF